MESRNGHAVGKVSLVGAGPGDPELLTLKAQRRLQEAEVIIFDYLVNPVVLQHAPPAAERVFIGKPRDPGRMSQAEVEALMVERALAGQSVVRLKGGDPFVFGRGGEEAEVLVNCGIPWEIVPGISAGMAAPAYAGIPLTHRDMASSVAFLTGHEADDKAFELDWRRLAEAVQTLVIFMGLKNLARIVGELTAAGKSPAAPIALVQCGTRLHQQVVVGTLANIVAKAQEHELKSPVLIVVGEVVNLRTRLQWFLSSTHLNNETLPPLEVPNEILASVS